MTLPTLLTAPRLLFARPKVSHAPSNLEQDGKYTISASSIRRLEKELMEKKEEVSRYTVNLLVR